MQFVFGKNNGQAWEINIEVKVRYDGEMKERPVYIRYKTSRLWGLIGSEEELCGRDGECSLFSDYPLLWAHGRLILFSQVSPCDISWSVCCEQKPSVISRLKHLSVTGRPSSIISLLCNNEEAVCFR